MLDEALIVAQRMAHLSAQQAVLTLMALSATPNMNVKTDSTKKAHELFVQFTTTLMGGGDGD